MCELIIEIGSLSELHVLHNEESCAEINETSHFVIVSQNWAQHFDKPLFTIFLVDQVLVLFDEFKASGELLGTKLLVHELGKACEVTACDIDHVLLRVLAGGIFRQRLLVEAVVVLLLLRVVVVAVVCGYLRDLRDWWLVGLVVCSDRAIVDLLLVHRVLVIEESWVVSLFLHILLRWLVLLV